MPKMIKNLRDAVFNDSSGVDVKSTGMLKNGAHRTKAQDERNTLKEMKFAAKVPKPYGGHNSHS